MVIDVPISDCRSAPVPSAGCTDALAADLERIKAATLPVIEAR